MEEAAREAAHKQQRWLTLAPSPRADHHHAELTVPPITAESVWDEEDDGEESERALSDIKTSSSPTGLKLISFLFFIFLR